jgi:hypothetical protein
VTNSRVGINITMKKKLKSPTTVSNDGRKTTTTTNTKGTNNNTNPNSSLHDPSLTVSNIQSMSIVMVVVYTIGPLLAIVSALFWFHSSNYTNNIDTGTGSATVLNLNASSSSISFDSNKNYKLNMKNENDSTDDNIPEWDINMNPSSTLHLGKDRCSIERIHERDMTYHTFVNEYWRKKPVILVREPHVNQKVQNYTLKYNMIQQFSTQAISIAGIEAYAFREEQTKVFSDYIHQLSSHDANNNTPQQSTTSTSAKHINFNFGIDKYGIGNHYIVPSLLNDTSNTIIEPTWHYQVAIAGYGIGLPFHWHGDVFAEVIHGIRRWFVTPPNHSPQFNPRTTSQQWFNDIYLPKLYNTTPSLPPETTTTNTTTITNKDTDGNIKHLMECTMYPNEALYVPADWFHATLSLGEAISITTSFAQQYRNERYTIDHSGAASHSYMLDAMEQHNYTGAIYHAQQLVTTYRTNSFVPYSWLGVVYTLQTQTLQNENDIVSSLQKGKDATEQCIQLNPYYAPCYVWYSRQLTALSYILKSSNPIQSQQYQGMAQSAKQHALTLSYDNDDEILDPRWQPKKKKTKNMKL